MSMSRKELTPRQQRFIEAYNGNATQAAIKAGYSARSTSGISWPAS